jgi:hypothetical protein
VAAISEAGSAVPADFPVRRSAKAHRADCLAAMEARAVVVAAEGQAVRVAADAVVDSVVQVAADAVVVAGAVAPVDAAARSQMAVHSSATV